MARILVTGCSTGIGRATAGELVGRGHHVIATARRPETLDGIDGVETLALDVDSDASVRAARAATGPVDVIVNNAGITARGPLESVPLDAAKGVFETNVWGALRVVQAYAPAMREAGHGRIVNVSSVEGVIATPLGGVYSASKHALEALSIALHYELAHFGVRTVIIQPGYFDTAMRTKRGPMDLAHTPYRELDEQWQGNDTKLLGGPRPGPEAVARAIADAIEDPDPPLRVPVGTDAEVVLATRAQLDDSDFERAMRTTLNLTW